MMMHRARAQTHDEDNASIQHHHAALDQRRLSPPLRLIAKQLVVLDLVIQGSSRSSSPGKWRRSS
jgi:hypothetical protein